MANYKKINKARVLRRGRKLTTAAKAVAKSGGVGSRKGKSAARRGATAAVKAMAKITRRKKK